MLHKLILSSILAVISVGTSFAQTVDASRPDTLVRALQDLGYRAVLTTDNIGDPMVETAINGWNYNIYFYECENNENCGTLQFSMGFDLPEGTTLEAAQRYNHGYLVGKVSLDEEQDPWLRWIVSTRGGLTRTNFNDVLAWWESAVVDFEKEFPFPSSDEEAAE